MDDNIRELAKVAIAFRNHDTMEFGPNEYWDEKLRSALRAVGVKTRLTDDEETMSIDEGK